MPLISGSDRNRFSLDAIAGYAFNALTFQTFGGAPTSVGFDPNSIVSGCFGRAFAGSAEFAKTHVAVAANSIEPAREIAARFREKTGHEAFRVASSPRSP
jgi:hypothetical protein